MLTAAPFAFAQEIAATGVISGSVVDGSGATINGAQVNLSTGTAPDQEAVSGQDGRFSFSHIAPGPFHLKVTAPGFASQTSAGSLAAGEVVDVPGIVLTVATVVSNTEVTLSRTELAEAQMKDEEKQRVLGFLPNYYVSYLHDAVPMNSKQKFKLAWRTTIDPVGFAIAGVIAGVQQAQNDFKGYGQGAQGYGKRYGASYANFFSATMISSALLPAVLRQDPRYFYRGEGTTRSRVMYALANAVIRKGDNGHWQPNYSDIVGNLAAGGLSNLYYPAGDRNGLRLTFENAFIGVAADAAANLFEEFVSRKATPALNKGGASGRGVKN